MTELFSVPIASIFARELLEACVIIVQYRTLVQRSGKWEETCKPGALKKIWYCAGAAAVFAIFINVCIAIPLAVLGNDLDKTAAEVIEGVSKVVAAICIMMLSVKVPKWLQLGPYGRVSSSKTLNNVDRELYFNVTWNIWREIAEIGIFLIPFFLQGNLEALPISALVGAVVGLGLGALMYIVLHYTKQKVALAVIMVGITGWLACGLFTGGMHEFEEVLGETPDVFHFPGCASSKAASCSFWHHKKFPFALVKPFGYSHSPTVLQMLSFWFFFALLVIVHAVKYQLAVWKANKGLSKGADIDSEDAQQHNEKVEGV